MQVLDRTRRPRTLRFEQIAMNPWKSRKLVIWIACLALFTWLLKSESISEDIYEKLVSTLLWVYFIANATIASAKVLNKNNSCVNDK